MSVGTNIQSVNLNNNVQPKMRTNFRAQNAPFKDYPPDTVEINGKTKTGMSDGAKVGIGLGILGTAALAFAWIYQMTRGCSGGKSIPTSEVKDLKNKIAKLKESIKAKYELERKAIDKKALTRLNMFQRACLEHAKAGKANPCEINSITDFNRVIKYIQESKHGNNKSLADLQADIIIYPKVLKAKLQELSNDFDWIQLRKLRHKIQNSQCKDNNDFCRLLLIDEVLFSKANNEVSSYLQTLNLSVDDAIKLIKTPNTAEEFNKISMLAQKANPEKYKWLNMVKHDFGYKLNVKDLYISKAVNEAILSAVHNAKKAPGEIKKLECSIADVLEQKQKYQTNVIDLANKTRQSTEIKELKDLLAQLKELENKK